MGRQPSFLRRHITRHRTLLGEFTFELIIVFVGVTAAFALENYRQARQEAAYYRAMVGGLRVSLDDWETHGSAVDRQVATLLRNFDAARKQGNRESGAERPPTKAWDGIVMTGAARSFDPSLFFRLARFYSRADSFGDRYLRYNAFTEERVLPYADNTAVFYQGRQLKPEYAAHVDGLRDLQREEHALVVEAGELRDSLPR